jgi:hypothetical protein
MLITEVTPQIYLWLPEVFTWLKLIRNKRSSWCIKWIRWRMASKCRYWKFGYLSFRFPNQTLTGPSKQFLPISRGLQIFALLDPDPDCESRSRDPNCIRIQSGSGLITLEKNKKMDIPYVTETESMDIFTFIPPQLVNNKKYTCYMRHTFLISDSLHTPFEID